MVRTGCRGKSDGTKKGMQRAATTIVRVTTGRRWRLDATDLEGRDRCGRSAVMGRLSAAQGRWLLLVKIGGQGGSTLIVKRGFLLSSRSTKKTTNI